MRSLVNGAAGVDLIANPHDVWPIYAQGRVLVNPARSGSGVNIKSVEMLQLEVPIVSTPVGVGGLPDDVKSQFFVADSPEDFAASILRALDLGVSAVDIEARKRACMRFSPEVIKEVIAVIRSNLISARGA